MGLTKLLAPLLLPSLGFAVCGCATPTDSSGGLKGTITIDGSSTVEPISSAMAEEFAMGNRNLRIPVGTSGTGGGFKKLIANEIDICDASRPIKESEAADCAANGIEFIELPVAFDGLSVCVNPKNTWVDHLTVDELKRIWMPGSTVKKWSDVRAGWPEVEIKLYGPGQDSGTFDYFTDVIVGEEGASRPDYSPSEDDNVLVTGVANDEGALGYFGFAFYDLNKDKLKIVPIDGGSGPVIPSAEAIRDGTYAPLSRPLFIYVAVKAAARPEVKAFVEFYLSSDGARLVEDVKYVPLPQSTLDLALKRFQNGVKGSMMHVEGASGLKLEDLLKSPK